MIILLKYEVNFLRFSLAVLEWELVCVLLTKEGVWVLRPNHMVAEVTSTSPLKSIKNLFA
jgi:hypothetical protein